MFRIKSQFFYFIFVITAECRKFDLEAESRKLFGEDLKGVLRKFRRTPEYLKILKDKVKDLEEHLSKISIHAYHYHNNALQVRVNEMVGLNTTDSGLLRSHRFEDPRPLREGDVSSDDKGIQELDKYHDNKSKMPVHEKNSFVDLGFEYAGRVIHSIIKGFGSEDEELKSTMLNAEDNRTTTTVHAEVHQVTTAPPETTVDLSTAALHERAGVKSKYKRGRYTVITE